LKVNKLVPDSYFAREARRAAVDGGDCGALESALPWLIVAIREATNGTVSGMVDEYRRYYGDWGFDLARVRQPVTIWQGEQDTWVPLSHARRLASALPNRTLRIMPSNGHLLPLAIADEILEDLAP
jgi:pimeloyl-ACP methyl ester carboxylesterase